MQTNLILVGGFLGAGKTTLVAKAAARLAQRGRRVGLITNDQADNLVDTAILEETADAVQEVAGGCFCCRFDDLLAAMNRLIDTQMPDVLIGEPVGSCTDLSATVLQPIKKLHADRFRVSPFSVLVDVKQVRMLERLRRSLRNAQSPRFPENVMYIYEKQLEEADLIVLNKADLLSADELAEIEATLRREFSQAPVVTISALRGTGVDDWLDRVLGADDAGRTITEVDYDQYADGEAALGWLNAVVRIESPAGIDAEPLCAGLMQALQSRFQEIAAEVAHLKLHLSCSEGKLVANLTSNDGELFMRNELSGRPAEATLLVNVRAKIDPDRLRAICEQCVGEIDGGVQTRIEDLRCFAPSRPTPTHRFEKVV
jgi:G3E family GTPase